MSNKYYRMLISLALLATSGLILRYSEAGTGRIPVESVDGKCVIPADLQEPLESWEDEDSGEGLLESGKRFYVWDSCSRVTCHKESDGSFFLQNEYCDHVPLPDNPGCVVRTVFREEYPKCCPKLICHRSSNAKMIEKRQEDLFDDLYIDPKDKDLYEYATYLFFFCMQFNWNTWIYGMDVSEKMKFQMRLRRQEEELSEESSYELPQEGSEKEIDNLQVRFDRFSLSFDKCGKLVDGLFEDKTNSGKDAHLKLSASEELLLHELTDCISRVSYGSSENESNEAKAKILSLLSRRKRQSESEESLDARKYLFNALNICFAEPPKSEPVSVDEKSQEESDESEK